MRISDWSSDVCSSDLMAAVFATLARRRARETEQCRAIDVPNAAEPAKTRLSVIDIVRQVLAGLRRGQRPPVDRDRRRQRAAQHMPALGGVAPEIMDGMRRRAAVDRGDSLLDPRIVARSEERGVGQRCVSTVKTRWSPY